MCRANHTEKWIHHTKKLSSRLSVHCHIGRSEYKTGFSGNVPLGRSLEECRIFRFETLSMERGQPQNSTNQNGLQCLQYPIVITFAIYKFISLQIYIVVQFKYDDARIDLSGWSEQGPFLLGMPCFLEKRRQNAWFPIEESEWQKCECQARW